MKLIFFLLVMVGLCAGCGKKGALVAPEALLPAPVADLQVGQKGEQFLVSWSRPTREEGGSTLRNLAGFRLLKREVLPPGQDCEECANAYRLVAHVDQEYPQGVLVVGDRFFFFDTGLTEGKSYRYLVFSLQKDGSVSHPSNRAEHKKVVAPAPPVVTAQSTPTGIVLRWGIVAAPVNGRIEGYKVYRKRSQQKFSPVPLATVPSATDCRWLHYCRWVQYRRWLQYRR